MMGRVALEDNGSLTHEVKEIPPAGLVTTIAVATFLASGLTLFTFLRLFSWPLFIARFEPQVINPNLYLGPHIYV